MLKSGLQLHGTDLVDKTWLTCCVLHYMLLEVDGLDTPWDGLDTQTNEWEGDLGCLDIDDIPVPFCCFLS
jgi:hypothetical protein